MIEVDRGGRITWHGPGQLVAYPIVLLAERMNLTGYVRVLEQALIATCAEFGLHTVRVAGRSGVWLPATGGRPERKIAAIGVHVARGVTSHGVALNCDPDLSAFDRIVPCGISDAGVTSLSPELGRQITVDDALPRLRHWMCEALDGRLPVRTETVHVESRRAECRPGRPIMGCPGSWHPACGAADAVPWKRYAPTLEGNSDGEVRSSGDQHEDGGCCRPGRCGRPRRRRQGG